MENITGALSGFRGAHGVCLAGLAALLRSGFKLSPRLALDSRDEPGSWALGISTLVPQYQTQYPFLLVGVSCTLAGLGGMTTVDFVAPLFRTVVLNNCGMQRG